MHAISFHSDGNLTFDGTNVYDYDAENRLAEVSTPAPLSVLYSFDPLDRRVQQNAEGAVTRFLYSGAQEIAEYDGLGNLIRRFVPGAGFGEVAVTVAATGGRVYHHADALGSTVARSDETGAMVERYAYGPFGEEAGAPDGTPFRYTGQRFDAETGLYYYRARAYSPALGRFLQPDPIGTEGGINLYAYVENDPVNATDPSGTCGPPCSGAFGAALGIGLEFLFNSESIGNNIALGNYKAVGYQLGAAAVGGFVAGATGVGAIKLAERAGKAVFGASGAVAAASTVIGSAGANTFGNSVKQGISINTGLQDSFNFKESAFAAATGGLSSYAPALVRIVPGGAQALQNPVANTLVNGLSQLKGAGFDILSRPLQAVSPIINDFFSTPAYASSPGGSGARFGSSGK